MRWASILRNLGHRVKVASDYEGVPADLMIALHAWRSAGSINSFRARYPEGPLVVGLAGTDVYRFQESDPETTLGAMQKADRLVGLHDLIGDAIPAAMRPKLRVIHQSAAPLAGRLPPLRTSFEVLVVGNLREEKDPLRAAYAARLLPPESRVRILHLGKPYDETWANSAQEEMKNNHRYVWRGEVPGWAVRKAMARAQLMVLSSVMEGGANVISEAIVAGLPVIASAIPGSIGLLGPDYPGYYPVQNTAALSQTLHRAETDATFLAALLDHYSARLALFAPEREHEAWRNLLAELSGGA